MSKRPRKRATRPGRQPRPRRPSGTRVIAEHLDDDRGWDEVLHAVEDFPGIAAEIVRAVQARRDAGTLALDEAERIIEGVVEHEAVRLAQVGSVIKSLMARINAIEREHGLTDDEAWLRHDGPPEWRMLNRVWEAYVDATMIRILESLDEHDLAEFIADRWPVDGGYGSEPDDEALDALLLGNGGASGGGEAILEADGAGQDGGPTAEPAHDAATTRVIAAVIARGDELLVCQRPAHKRHGGLWEFPGGKVEPDESDEASARRELAEELGVRVVRAGAAELEVLDPDSEFLIAFVPIAIEGEPQCREHSALRWGRPEEIALLPLAPSDRRYVESLLAGGPHGDT